MTTLPDLWPRLRARYELLAARLRERGSYDIPPFPTDDLQAAANVNQQLVTWLQFGDRPICVTVKQDVWRVPMKERPAPAAAPKKPTRH